MAAVTRWVQYDISETGVAGTGGGTLWGRGTRGYVHALTPKGDEFQIGTTTNKLYLKIDSTPGTAFGITLASGTELDPRFVAKDITEAIHTANPPDNEGWARAQCVWENGKLKIYSGTLSSTSNVTVWSGTNTAHLELGFGSKDEGVGVDNINSEVDNYITVSGVYEGFFDETYRIIINKEVSVGTPVPQTGNNYSGTITVGGMFNNAADIEYYLEIVATNGETMNAGTGNVPTLEWTSTSNLDDSSEAVELLYSDYWYDVGTKGLMVKFTDAVFNTIDPAWNIACTWTQYAEGSNPTAIRNQAKFIWGSDRGDDSISASTCSEDNWVRLGSRGLWVKWYTTAVYPGVNLQGGDSFFVMCSPPQPTWNGAAGITNLNYGNVTVSTESPVRSVIFEILQGAVLIDTVKFGLQSHGNFEHHGEGLNDTYFRFGTVGPGATAGVFPEDGLEWRTGVTANDINDPSDIPETYMHASKHNLSAVADADSSETIGVSTYAGMVADPIWLNIKLGQSEVGANSTINYRIYFDYQ